MPTRIAHVVENLNQGGIARVVMSLAAGMRALHIEADILTLDSRSQYTLNEQINIRQVPIIGLTTSPSPSKLIRRFGHALIGKRGFRHFASPWFCRQMAHHVNRNGYDCVFFHGLPVCWSFHRWSQPNAAFVLHSIKSQQVAADTSWWEYKLYERTFLSKQFVAVSEAVRKDAIEHFPVDPARITTINNPLDFEEIKSKADDGTPMSFSGISYFLFVGRLASEKRVDLLLRAFAKANVSEHLLILGQGPLQTNLEQLAAHLSISDRVHFLGFIENPYPYMRLARALVLPSRFEGLSVVMIEALAVGTPVISSRTQAAEEIMTGPLATGLFDIDDEAGLVTKLREAAQGRLPVTNPEFLQRFDKRMIAKEYLKLAERLSGGRI